MMDNEKRVITNDELQRLIQADRIERANAAAADINAALNRHNCELRIVIEMSLDGSVKPGYKIVPL